MHRGKVRKIAAAARVLAMLFLLSAAVVAITGVITDPCTGPELGWQRCEQTPAEAKRLRRFINASIALLVLATGSAAIATELRRPSA